VSQLVTNSLKSASAGLCKIKGAAAACPFLHVSLFFCSIPFNALPLQSISTLKQTFFYGLRHIAMSFVLNNPIHMRALWGWFDSGKPWVLIV